MENLLTAQNLLLFLLVIAASYYIYLRAFVYNKIKRVEKEFTIYFKKGASLEIYEIIKNSLEKKFKTEFEIIEQTDSRYALMAVRGPIPPVPPPPVGHPDFVKKLFISLHFVPTEAFEQIAQVVVVNSYVY